MADGAEIDSESCDQPPSGPFDGPSEFRRYIRQALCCAARQGWRELILCDPDFHDWPLGELDMLDVLDTWASAGGAAAGRSPRRCLLLAGDFESVRVRHPRFAQWRVRWGHLIECRLLAARNTSDVPSVLWAPGWSLQRRDVERNRGVASSDPQQCLMLHEMLREWIAGKSRPGFPATILGL